MHTTELKNHKRNLYLMLSILSIVLLSIIYFAFFSGKFDDSNLMKIIYAGICLYLGYTIYVYGVKLVKNEAILILTGLDITVNDKLRSRSFLWVDVTEWKIEKDNDGNTHYLIIKTVDTKRKVNISWLEMQPDELAALIQSYKTRQ